MGEAAEIAKLRLFLKLVAQLEDVSQIEPLPDLDFNIKTGNLLVGIADPSDVTRRFGDVLQSLPGLHAAEQAARLAGDAYDRFTTAQLSDTSATGVSGKQRLANQIQAATNQADNSLFDMRGESGSFEGWRKSHVPFHWFAEFPSVWRNGGFDVVIGNPPYINKGQVNEYTWRGYATEKCPDLYAICMERASTLLNERGRMAMIVMHNLCFSRNYQSLRAHLLGIHGSIWVSSYARIPAGLFPPDVRVRNAIVIASWRGDQRLLVTECRRWKTEHRPFLFSLTEYAQPSGVLLKCGAAEKWPFINDSVVAEALKRLISTQPTIKSGLSGGESEYRLAVKDNAQYRLGVYDRPPLDIFPDGTERVSPMYKWFSFNAGEDRDLVWLIWGGRWGYVWWLTYDDEFHVNSGVVGAFPSDLLSLVESAMGQRLLALAGQLRKELPKHLAYKGNKRRVARYDILKCRHITDEADWLLAQAWGLTREQYEAAGNLRDRMTFGSRD